MAAPRQIHFCLAGMVPILSAGTDPFQLG